MKVILAARLSALQKHGQQGLGLDTQDQDGRAWAERTVDPETGKPHEVIAVAADTKSGTVAPWDRPRLRPWVTDPVKMAQYDGIVAVKNDRLSRGCWADEARIRLWAEENGKRLIIVDGPQWPPRHDGDKWQWEAMADQARKEWEAIQRRLVKMRNELRERGHLVGRPIFGYEVAGDLYKKTLVPSEIGRIYVPIMYARVIAGASCNAIAKWLDAEGVPTVAHCSRDDENQCRVHRRPFADESSDQCTAERKWRGTTVAQLLRSTTYKGQRVQANTVMPCEALVDPGTWQQAQDALSGRAHLLGTRNSPNRAMLASALTCPNCKSPMYRHKLSSGAPYYRCHGSGPKPKGCGNMVRLVPVDEAVDDLIHRAFDFRVLTETVVPGDDHSTEKDLVRAQMRALAARASAGEISDDDYDRELARLRAERDRLNDLPATEATVIEALADETYAQEWDATLKAKRGPWLRAKGFTVTASKERVTLALGAVTAEATL